MVNDSCSPISQVEEKKKQYTARDVNRAEHERQFYHIIDQSAKQILHEVDNNIIQNPPIMWEDAIMTEDIYGPSVPYL